MARVSLSHVARLARKVNSKIKTNLIIDHKFFFKKGAKKGARANKGSKRDQGPKREQHKTLKKWGTKKGAGPKRDHPKT